MKTTISLLTLLLFAFCHTAVAEPGTSGASTATTMAYATIVIPASVEIACCDTKQAPVIKKEAIKTSTSAQTADVISNERIANGIFKSSMFAISSESMVSFSISTPDKITLSGNRRSITITDLKIYTGQSTTRMHLHGGKTTTADNGKIYFCLDGKASAKTTGDENYTGSYDISVDYQ